MKSRVALQQLAEVTESQWGMVTTAQARAQGIDHMTLKRLNDDGHLIRLIHGVYRNAGAPSAEHEELRAAWLAAEPRRLALERLHDNRPGIVVSGPLGASSPRRHGDRASDSMSGTAPETFPVRTSPSGTACPRPHGNAPSPT